MRPFHAALVFALIPTATAFAQRSPAAPRVRAKPAFRLEPVALTGEAAPGVAGGTFQFFGAIPATGMLTAGSPAIDAEGNLAFAAGLTTPAGNRMGLWKRADGPVELLAFQNDPAPGTAQTFQAFPSVYFGENPSLVDGRHAFRASLNLSGSQPTFGLWSDRSGALAVVLLEWATLPGLPPSGAVMQPQGVLVGNGRIVLTTLYSDDDDGGYIDAEQEGFWRDDGASIALVVRDDAPAPGCPAGVLFGEASDFAQGSFDHWDVDSQGRIAFNGFVKGPGVALLSDEGVWYDDGSSLALLAREGNPAPGAGAGAVFGSGAGLHSFGNSYNPPVETNDLGSVLFGAGLRGPNFDYGESVWVRRGGALELVVKAFSGSSAFNADPAPGFGPGVTFSHVYGARLGPQDQVAITAFAGIVQGLWIEREGELELVARAGGAVPGVPGAIFLPNFGLTLGEIDAAGTLYYQGAFEGPGVVYENNSALFAVDPQGVARIVVRRGMTVQVAPGDPRVVSQFGAGESSADGTKTLHLVFTDGTSGLFTARLR